MFRYNFRTYGDKKLNKAIDAAARANVGLIAMKTQGSAMSFAGKWEPFKKSGKWTRHQAVLKAVWADERITAAVSHMDTFKKLKENIEAVIAHITKMKPAAAKGQYIKKVSLSATRTPSVTITTGA